MLCLDVSQKFLVYSLQDQPSKQISCNMFLLSTHNPTCSRCFPYGVKWRTEQKYTLMSLRKSKFQISTVLKKIMNLIFSKSACKCDIQLDGLAKGRGAHEWLNLSILIRWTGHAAGEAEFSRAQMAQIMWLEPLEWKWTWLGNLPLCPTSACKEQLSCLPEKNHFAPPFNGASVGHIWVSCSSTFTSFNKRLDKSVLCCCWHLLRKWQVRGEPRLKNLDMLPQSRQRWKRSLKDILTASDAALCNVAGWQGRQKIDLDYSV